MGRVSVIRWLWDGKSEDGLGAGSVGGGRAEGVESMRAELAEGRGQCAEDG